MLHYLRILKQKSQTASSFNPSEGAALPATDKHKPPGDRSMYRPSKLVRLRRGTRKEARICGEAARK